MHSKPAVALKAVLVAQALRPLPMALKILEASLSSRLKFILEPGCQWHVVVTLSNWPATSTEARGCARGGAEGRACCADPESLVNGIEST